MEIRKKRCASPGKQKTEKDYCKFKLQDDYFVMPVLKDVL